MKRRKEIVLVLSLVIGITFVMFTGDVTAKKKASEQKVIQFWFPEGLAEMQELMAQHTKRFEKLTGIKVKVSHVDWEVIRSKLRLVVDAGSPPDVVQVGFDTPVVYAGMGKLKPLNEYIKRDQINPADYAPVLWEAGTVENKVYGIPFLVEDRVIFYRTDLLQKKGLKPPAWDWTWNDLKEYA